MLRTELAQEAWRAWVKDKPFQSEDTAKGFMAGFNFCLNGKVKVEGGDKGELISANFSLQDKLNEAKKIIGNLYAICKDNHYPNSSVLMEQAEQFLKEETEQTCSNCKHYAKAYELCCYSLGDEDYDCRGRKWRKS